MKLLTSCIAAIAFALLLGGCTFLNARVAAPEAGRLAEAAMHLEKGNETAAAKLLEDICISNHLEGVTDEALFRLSLLQLRMNDDPDKMMIIQQRLAMLHTRYPESRWSRLSWPLTEYMTRMEAARDELRSVRQKYTALSRENRDLTLSNQQLQLNLQTLARENREINHRMEKLKSLDLELERKTRF